MNPTNADFLTAMGKTLNNVNAPETIESVTINVVRPDVPSESDKTWWMEAVVSYTNGGRTTII